MKYRIDVSLKDGVLDPEARAIHDALHKQGYQGINQLVISKSFCIELADSIESPELVLGEIAKHYLVNPVAQTYSIQRLEP